MTGKEYKSLEFELKKAGYQKRNASINHEDWYIYKAFEYVDGLPMYQIFYCVYDWQKYNFTADRHYGLTVLIDVSRTIDERVVLECGFDHYASIEGVEKKAESFYKWVEAEMPLKSKDRHV